MSKPTAVRLFFRVLFILFILKMLVLIKAGFDWGYFGYIGSQLTKVKTKIWFKTLGIDTTWPIVLLGPEFSNGFVQLAFPYLLGSVQKR